MIDLRKGYVTADGKFPPCIDSTNYLTHRFVNGDGFVVGCLYEIGSNLPSAVHIDVKFLENKSPTVFQEAIKTESSKIEPEKSIPVQVTSEEDIELFDCIEIDDNAGMRMIDRYHERMRMQSKVVYNYNFKIVFWWDGSIFAECTHKYGIGKPIRTKNYVSICRFLTDFVKDFKDKVWSSWNEYGYSREFDKVDDHFVMILDILEKSYRICLGFDRPYVNNFYNNFRRQNAIYYRTKNIGNL